eukprot:gene19357-25223_t
MSTISIVNKCTLIESEGLRFLIMDAPKDSNLHLYINECKKHNVVHIVRISEPSYNKDLIEKAGIQLHEMWYDDGQGPSDAIIEAWLELVEKTFKNKKNENNPCIAVHCVAGLGRAPVLVAIALIEYGMESVEAVTFIRERRRGAINQVQLQYLDSYIPRRKNGKKCIIM